MISSGNVYQEVTDVIEEANKTLASFEQVKNFRVLSKDFSIEGGEMTPTLKMKRAVIEKNFKDLIDKMYSP